jgi:choline dehydrogenase
VRGLKLLLKVAHTEPLAEAIDETATDPILHTQTHKLDDGQLADVVRSQAETLYHLCCTARMAPQKEGGVVDPYLRVHGIPNLRVVDASVFPTIIAAHTASRLAALELCALNEI